MRHGKIFLIAAPVALGLLAAPAAHAEWRHGGWGHRGPGFPIVGALLGLGAAAAVGAAIASQPAYYPPPPVVYAPPPYYYGAPGYYYAPPVYAPQAYQQ